MTTMTPPRYGCASQYTRKEAERYSDIFRAAREAGHTPKEADQLAMYRVAVILGGLDPQEAAQAAAWAWGGNGYSVTALEAWGRVVA